MSEQRWWLSLVTILVTAVIVMGGQGTIRNETVQNLLQSASIIILGCTLLVLFRYANDTQSIAGAAIEQRDAMRDERNRRERNALARVSRGLAGYAILDKKGLTTAERVEEEGRVLMSISESLFTIDDPKYLDHCATVVNFLTVPMGDPERRALASELAPKLATLANGPLMAAANRDAKGTGGA